MDIIGVLLSVVLAVKGLHLEAIFTVSLLALYVIFRIEAKL